MSKRNFIIQNKLTNQDQLSVKVYLQEINSNKHCLPIPLAQELEMFKELKRTGDKKMKDRLMLANLRWVITIAKQYENNKTLLEDLINEGNIGMEKAMHKFDPELGFKFITFATSHIRREINTYTNQVLADIVQPVNRKRIAKLLKDATKMLNKQGNFEPTVEEMVDLYMEIKEKKDPVIDVNYVVEMNSQSNGFISASTTMSHDMDIDLASTFVSSSDYNADNNITQNEKQNEIENALANILNEREKNVVMLHFGINKEEALTLEQVADILSYTRERIGQILQGALKKLANHKQLMFSILGSSRDKSQYNGDNASIIGNAKKYESSHI